MLRRDAPVHTTSPPRGGCRRRCGAGGPGRLLARPPLEQLRVDGGAGMERSLLAGVHAYMVPTGGLLAAGRLL